jgi:hypothetical protein
LLEERQDASPTNIDSLAGCHVGNGPENLVQLVGQQCVRVWEDHTTGGKDGGGSIANYKPQSPYNCKNNCFTWEKGFGGIEAMGDGTHGTNCAAFADSKCSQQFKLGETGNSVEHGYLVLPVGVRGYSMLCYFNC